MRFDTSQQARLSQQMKLAPRMIQSMEILQMPMMALQERVDQELESNVALETIEPGDDEERVDIVGNLKLDPEVILHILQGTKYKQIPSTKFQTNLNNQISNGRDFVSGHWNL